MPKGVKAPIQCPDCKGYGVALCDACEGSAINEDESSCTACYGTGHYDFTCIRCNGTGSIKPDRKPRTPKIAKGDKSDKPVMSVSDDELCVALEVAHDNLIRAFNDVTDRLSYHIDKDHIAYLHQAYDLSETRLFKAYARMRKIIIGH